MKVLMQNRPEQLWLGGDMVQLKKTMEALVRLNVEVEFSDRPVYPSAVLFRDFDVIHNFNFSMPWAKYQTWVAKKHKKPLVYSMIYHESDKFIPYPEQQIMADATDAMVFLTEGEKERVKRHLTINDDKCHIIPNGVDKFWFTPFTKQADIPAYVLTVGRVEPSKGQLPTAQACREVGIRYVMIGDRTDETYAQQCEAAGAAHFSSMPPEDLIKFYAQCSVFVLASAAEVQPLSVMEALAQGAQVVLTEKCEWETPNVVRCKPLDAQSIAAQIRVLSLRGKNLAGMREMEKMTWDHVALRLTEIYNKLCIT